MAFSASTGDVPQPAYLLFVANCLWTVAYDTQYSMVDREFDIKIGVKSTAILFGDADKVIIGSLQVMFILAMILAGRQFELGTLLSLSRHSERAPCLSAISHQGSIAGALLRVVSE